MQLSDWMAGEGIDDAEVAARLTAAGVKCDRSQVSKYRRRKIRPHWRVIAGFVTVTGGKVGADDWLMLEAAE